MKASIRKYLLSSVVLAATVIGFLATYGLVRLLFPEDSEQRWVQHMNALFYNRGFIPPVLVGLFWLSVGVLLRKAMELRGEVAAFMRAEEAVDSFQKGAGSLIWSDSPSLRTALSRDDEEPAKGTLAHGRIFRALDRFEKTQDTRCLEESFRNQASSDYENLEISYNLLRYLVWVIPSLGFIGTVLGISQAIAGFSGAIAGAADFSLLKEALPDATLSLGIAFDTTLLALVFSAIVSYGVSFVRTREERLLVGVDALCFNKVTAMFREHSTLGSEICDAIHRVEEQLRKAMSGNRAEVVEAMTSRLPEEIQQQAVFPLMQSLDRIIGSIEQAVSHLAAGRQEDDRGQMEELEKLTDEVQALAREIRELRRALGQIDGKLLR